MTGTSARCRWALFAATVPHRADVSHLRAWPLTLDDTVRVAAVVLYATAAGSTIAVEDYRGLADAIEKLLAVHLSRSDVDDFVSEVWSARSAVHQATGMVMARRQVPADDAILLLKAHAFSTGTTLDKACRVVIGNRGTFPDPWV